MYTFDSASAAVAFDIVIQSKKIEGRDDLAKGADGKYRYVIPVPDVRERRKVVEAQLVRSGKRVAPGDVPGIVGEGWEGARRDINEGRGGDYLYLVWRTFWSLGSV